MSRTALSIRNSVISLLAQVVTLIMQFVVQIVFVRSLTANYLGANGLFTNLVSFLSFAELGIGASITFALYKPLVDEDWTQLDALLSFFKKIYRAIGLFIIVSGVALTQFLGFFVRKGSSIPDIQFMFLIYVLGTAVSYFYSYSRSIFIAAQFSYINTLNQVGFRVLQNVGQIIALFYFQSYLGYLVLIIAGNFLSNLMITRMAESRFPNLTWRSKSLVSPEVLETLKKNVIGNVSAKIGAIVVFGTDNILISKYLGLGVVGLYSNYTLITQGIISVLSQVMNAVLASFGNLGATASVEKQEKVYYDSLYFVSLLTFVSTITMYAVIQPFVQTWFSSEYVLPGSTVFLIALNLGFNNLRKANLNYMSALGLFWPQRYKSLVEAAVNFIVSFALIRMTKLGINAVLLGTIFSNLTINFWWETLVVFKYGFNKSMKKALLKLGIQHVVLAFGLLIVKGILQVFEIRGMLSILVSSLVFAMGSLIFYVVLFIKTPETEYFKTVAFGLVRKVLKR